MLKKKAKKDNEASNVDSETTAANSSKILINIDEDSVLSDIGEEIENL